MRKLPSQNEHFDAIVVGSGFGGAVMAYRLAEAGQRVCVLERGKRYPPGSFARTPFEMRHNFWRPKKDHYGLFDVWSFDHIDAVVSAGVGGGSLIYANVLIRKDSDWFDGWPVTRKQLDEHYAAVEKMLAPQVYPRTYQRRNRTSAMQYVARELKIRRTTYDKVDPTVPQWYLPQLAVTFQNPGQPPVPGQLIQGGEKNIHHAFRETCRLCGECSVGCNYGSKNTLDFNYLSEAERSSASICDLCEVESIFPARRGGRPAYGVEFVARDPRRLAEETRLKISCDRLVLSCGTFGTALLLFRSRDKFPALSSTLGTRFSGNGDVLAFVRNCTRRAKDGRPVAVPLNASRAPVVTSTFRFPDHLDGAPNGKRGFYVQDGGYPLAGDFLWEALQPAAVVYRFVRFAWHFIASKLRHRSQTRVGAQLERLIGDAHPSFSSMALLGVGRDVADGEFALSDDQRLQLSWRRDKSSHYFAEVDKQAKIIAERMGGTYAADPLTKLFNRIITVHPVGGCPMGLTDRDGVVDSNGEVFNYPGLYIADGSVMPGPVGPNPSFTIAALAEKFAANIISSTRSTG